LPHAALRVLVILASQYWGGNNGTMALTSLYAQRFGLNSRDTIYRSLCELKQRGLILQTRQGWKSKRHFALYALNWKQINNRDGQPLNVAEPCDRSKWREWKVNTSGRS